MEPLKLSLMAAMVATLTLMLMAERFRAARLFPVYRGWIWIGLGVMLVFVALANGWSLVISKDWLREHRLLHGEVLGTGGGIVVWYVFNTFVGYWYHGLQHRSSLAWRALHQVHHGVPRVDIPSALVAHPLDVIGWDGCCYPYIFSIHDFEPITGRVHQPPPVHQTFETNAFVVCSFVPRLYDYHPQAIPAPYNHSNIDSDEVIYYVDGDFMSRKNVTRGMITLHPAGIPHGPHPGAVEKSIGAKETKELAVMVDTFRPLMLTKQALDIENTNYIMSWAE